MIHPVKSWYAIAVRPATEHAVAETLSARGIVVFSPIYTTKRLLSDRATDIEGPLFPGYVFCSLESGTRLTKLCVPNVVAWGAGKAAPAIADEREIRAIQKMIHAGLRVEPWPYLRQGANRVVRIVSGSLRGISGILVGRQLLVVSLTLLQRSVVVDLSAEKDIAVAAGSTAGT